MGRGYIYIYEEAKGARELGSWTGQKRFISSISWTGAGWMSSGSFLNDD